MKILITGRTGQVGHELERSLRGLGQIVAIDRGQMDLSDVEQMRTVIRVIKPDLIINTAAYTAVDRAESEPDIAMRVNALAPGVMAEEARKLGAAMIHYSTDYVFDGNSDSPYHECDAVNPVNVYGRSKREGELAIRDTGIPHLILRTSWIYSMRGQNFLLTVLRLMRERNELRIVNDQYGSPNWSRSISDLTGQIVAQLASTKNRQEWWKEKSGTYHLSAQGGTTWHGFTQAILSRTPLARKPALVPIKTEEYPTPAVRPRYSLLSCDKLGRTFGLIAAPWEQGLDLCMRSTAH